MPVRMLPPAGDQWPAYLAPPSTEFGPRIPDHLQRIIDRAADQTGIPSEVILGKRHSRSIIEARRQAVAEMSALGMSATAIGRVIGRCHPAVLNLLKGAKCQSV